MTVGTSDNDTPILCLPASSTITPPSTEDPIAEVEEGATIAEVKRSAIAEVDESTATETHEPTQ